jgi:hypothetical protein
MHSRQRGLARSRLEEAKQSGAVIKPNEKRETGHDLHQYFALNHKTISSTQGDYANDERPLKRSARISAAAPPSRSAFIGGTVLSARRDYRRTQGIAAGQENMEDFPRPSAGFDKWTITQLPYSYRTLMGIGSLEGVRGCD